MPGADRRIVIGRVTGVFGVKGWVKVESFTRPVENLLNYPRWQLERRGRWQEMRVQDVRPHGKGFVAQLADEAGRAITDRDEAAKLRGAEVAVLRSDLPPAAPGEYYWTDLIGLDVLDLEGASLGRVKDLMETGANDVLVVAGERERLIPFVKGPIVKEVDLENGRICVDWSPDY
jgi:16S rRNA processing protein RimM